MIAEALPTAGPASADRSPSALPGRPATGRLMRLLRSAASLTIGEAAVAAGLTIGRIRELERGLDEPRSWESFELVRAYLLCQPCFKKHLSVAHALDGLAPGTRRRRQFVRDAAIRTTQPRGVKR